MRIVAHDREGLVALNDGRLAAFLRASGREAERELERLIVEEARPVIAGVVARYTRTGTNMRAEDADDVIATIHVRLVQKLRDVARDPEEAIYDFQSYVAVIAYHAVSDFMRKRFPARARLKKRLRYALHGQPQLATWMTAAGQACGLRGWEGREDAVAEIPARLAERESAPSFLELIAALGRPVLVDALVDFVADRWNGADKPAEGVDAEPSAAVAADARVEAYDFALALWDEIRQLRPMQRKALLLNLRYGAEMDVMSTFVLSGIAPLREIAAALEVTVEELAAMWKELPWDDQRIAAWLGVTRQQVINLRKSARERLSRRLRR